MSCISQEPMKMQENQSVKPGKQWEGREVCWGGILWQHSLEEADIMASSFGE